MKRTIILLLILLLAVSPVLAETRESVIYLEGEPEPITETLYESPLGFSFWYDADALTVDESNSESGGSLMVYPTETDLPIYMELLLPDAMGETAWEFLDENEEDGIEYEQDYNEYGTELLGFQRCNDEAGIIQGFYAAASGENQVGALITCEEEAWEGWGRRLLQVLKTLSFGPQPAIQVEEGEDKDWVSSVTVSDDEYSTWVCFFARRPVTDFRVLALDMTDDEDSFGFNTTTVYAKDVLVPDEPLRVSLTFYGDIPNNGISFVDEDGTFRQYAVDMSGEDGSLYLWAF